LADIGEDEGDAVPGDDGSKVTSTVGTQLPRNDDACRCVEEQRRTNDESRPRNAPTRTAVGQQ
jgi:hypothetical protein